jgi:hypothetical protein
VSALDAWVLPHQAAVPRVSSPFDGGGFTDDGIENRVVTLGRRVVEYATTEPDTETFENGQNIGG